MINGTEKKNSATGKLAEINGGLRRGCPLPCTILGNDAEGNVWKKGKNLLK